MAFMLRTRLNDEDEWSEPQAFRTRRERDKAGSFARIIGGIRTHSYEETRAEVLERIAEEQWNEPL